MVKNLIYTALGLMELMGTLALGIVNADVTVTHYTGSNISYTLNGNETFTGVGTITITDCDGTNADTCTTITILDRNLGAIKAGTGCDFYSNGNKNCVGGELDPTYGYHFQWGNNHGFKPCSDSNGCSTFPNGESTGAQLTSITYNPFYESSTFIKGSLNWVNDNSIVDLWGGSTGDYISSLSGDNWKVNNASERQGPCPENFHIPSYGELLKIKDMMGNSASVIHTGLLIPFAGFRGYYGAIVVELSRFAYLWSSSPDDTSSPSSRYLTLSVGDSLNMYDDQRASANSLRCVYDSYQPYAQSLTFFTVTVDVSAGGSASSGSIEAVSGSSITGTIEAGTGFIKSGDVVLSTVTPNPGYIFSGWTTDCGETLTANCTFTGEFKEILYKVEFTGNSVFTGKVEVTSGTEVALTGNEIASSDSKDGYVFIGWNTDSGANEGLSNITVTGDIILYSIFKPITYTISFSGNAADATGIAPATINAKYDSGDIAPDNTFTLTGYTFTGWNTESDGNGTGYATGAELKNLTTTSGADIELYAQWEVNIHKLSFVVDGTTIQSGDVAYAATISAPTDPTKDCNSFAGWSSSVEGLTATGTMPDSDVIFTANWNYTCSRSSGGGGSSRSSSVISNDGEKSTEQSTGNQEDPSISSQNDDDVSSGANVENSEKTTQKDSSIVSENDGKIYSPEFQQAYEFAYENGITTKSTIQQAQMDGKLTRIEMAKMLSYYAINVMGKTPDTTKNVKFRDVTKKMDERYDNAVILAYQLGIMGQNMPRNRFRPNDEVSRAEFVTALSRMLYQTSDGEYEKTARYYMSHMSKLYNEGIVNDTNPSMKERRGYVMIMLMRTVK